MSRARMSPEEREFRSQLAKLVHAQPLIRGTLSLRSITCGKSGCRCAKGDKHLALYLTCSKEGRPRQLFIPKAREEDVRSWVANYQTIRDLLEHVSEIAWDKLKKRKE